MIMNENVKCAAEALVAALTEAGQIVATAESCTGGLISAAITSVPGSSAVFGLGVCAYSPAVKTSVLGVPEELIEQYGVVSSETVISMAQNAARLAPSDYAISVSGVAGPGGGTPDTPVGTVWIGWAYPGGADSALAFFEGDRQSVREQTAVCAMNIIVSLIKSHQKGTLA